MAITTQYLTGFEHGFVGTAATAGLGLFDTVTAGCSASTSSPRNGTYCLRIVAPANTAANVTKQVGISNYYVERFAVRVSSRPSSATAVIAAGHDGASGGWSVRISSTGVLTLVGSTTSTGPTIDTTSWHLIEVYLDDLTSGLSWQVDGVAQSPATNVSGGYVSFFRLGTTATTQPGFTADYDDWIIGTPSGGAEYFGDGKVIAQFPGSDMTHANVANFSKGDAGAALSGTVTDAYTMVDDAPGTGGWTATRSTTDNLALRVASAASRLTMKVAPTAETGTANAVRAIISYSSPSATANLAACSAKSSLVVTPIWGTVAGVGADFSEITNFFKSALITPTGGVWAASVVNLTAIDFGGCTSVDVSPVPTLQAWMLEVDWPISAPTGTDLFATPADTLAIVDEITPLLIAPILLPLAELLTVTDTLRYQDLGGTYATLATQYVDYQDLANGITILTGTAVPLADTLTIADARSADVGKLLNDPLTVTDANWRDAAKPLTDTITITDQASPVAALQQATADNLTVADQTATVAVLQRALGDTLAISDLQALQSDVLRALADTLGIVDLATPDLTTGSIAHQVPLVDLLTAVDASRVDVGKLLADTLTIADGQATQSDLARALADTLTVLDASTPVADRAQALADALVVTDQYAGVAATLRAFADTLTLVDATGTVAGFATTLADTLGVTDQQALLSTVQRVFAEDLTLADLASPLLGGGAALVQPLADLLAVTDNFSQVSTFERLLAETLTVADVLNSTATYTRALADTLTVADQLALLQAVVLAFNDPLTLADLASPFHSTGTPHLIPLADALSLIDGFDSTAAYLRAQADPLTLADALSSEVGLTVTRAETLTIVDNRTSVMARSADLADVLTIADAQTRASAALLTLPESLVISDVFLPFYLQYRPPRLTMIL